jgi:hypothetical protein
VTTPRATAKIIRSVVAGVGTAVIVAMFALSGGGTASAAPRLPASEALVKPSPKPTKPPASPTPILKTITITGPNISRTITIRSDRESSLYSAVLAQVSWMNGQTPDLIKTTPTNLGPAYHVTLLTAGVPTAAYDLYPECPGGARAFRPAENGEARGWFYAPLTMPTVLQSAGVTLPNPALASGFSAPPLPTAEKGATLGQLMHQSRLALALAGGAALIVLITLALVARLVRRLDHRRGVPAALTRLDTVAAQDGRTGTSRRRVRPGVPPAAVPLNRPAGMEPVAPLATSPAAYPGRRPGAPATARPQVASAGPQAGSSGRKAGLSGRQAARAGSAATDPRLSDAYRRPTTADGRRMPVTPNPASGPVAADGPTTPLFRPTESSEPTNVSDAPAGASASNDPIRANNRRRWFGASKRAVEATRALPDGVERVVAADPVSTPVAATAATSEPLVVHPPKPVESMAAYVSTPDTAQLEQADTAQLDPANSAQLEQAETMQFDPANSAQHDPGQTTQLEQASTTQLDPANTTQLEQADTAQLDPAQTMQLINTETTDLQPADTETARSAESDVDSALTAVMASSVDQDTTRVMTAAPSGQDAVDTEPIGTPALVPDHDVTAAVATDEAPADPHEDSTIAVTTVLSEPMIAEHSGKTTPATGEDPTIVVPAVVTAPESDRNATESNQNTTVIRAPEPNHDPAVVTTTDATATNSSSDVTADATDATEQVIDASTEHDRDSTVTGPPRETAAEPDVTATATEQVVEASTDRDRDSTIAGAGRELAAEPDQNATVTLRAPDPDQDAPAVTQAIGTVPNLDDAEENAEAPTGTESLAAAEAPTIAEAPTVAEVRASAELAAPDASGEATAGESTIVMTSSSNEDTAVMTSASATVHESNQDAGADDRLSAMTGAEDAPAATDARRSITTSAMSLQVETESTDPRETESIEPPEAELTEAVADASLMFIATPDKPGGPGIVPAARKGLETIPPGSETDAIEKADKSVKPEPASTADTTETASSNEPMTQGAQATGGADGPRVSGDDAGTTRRRRVRRVPAARTPDETDASESARSSTAAPTADAE